MSVDLLVVGGGPVGLATGILARLHGLSAVVIDKRSEPLDKACGEGLMPPGVRELEAMGVRVPEWGFRPFVGIRYVDGDIVAEGTFAGGPGLGVRRVALVEGMLARARALEVSIELDNEVRDWRRDSGGWEVTTRRGPLHGRILVGADGLHSHIRRSAGLERRRAGKGGRFGVRRHFAVEPWSDRVEVYFGNGAEAYVTPVGPELVGVAFLWRGRKERFATLMPRFPELAARLADVSFASPARGAGPFRQDVSRRFGNGLALVGDAAGYLDPLTGEGMTIGFRSARALVETVAAKRPLSEYERAWRELSRTPFRMTAMLLRWADRPRLRRRLVAMLSRRPDLFSALLAVSSGDAPLSSLGVQGVFALASGVLRAGPTRS